ncbi:hypothetical protein C8R44DRAFT_760444 [Mycena epipterygia]|nr:hypothetical protein C8R44DRAFT_760444 [Mycena epipterygia]
MPSAFDILGVLSFAQSVITVFAAGILALQAWTEQLRDNKRALIQIHIRLSRLLHEPLEPKNPDKEVLRAGGGDHIRVEKLVQYSDNEVLPGMEKLVQDADKERTTMLELMKRTWYIKWLHSAEDAKLISEMSLRVSHMEDKSAEIRLTIAISKAVDAALHRAGLAPGAPQEMWYSSHA